ncbi:hypothetical protein C6I20_16785 [Aeromicrobium sp. A1-2]|uniref:hypothetical protein n=1 Tax=Aeromicrobium sp. A1-2 TaxID=2107713 RepID=UPI000E46D27A|nr:hypothetical protein [Aeromicrobium sp. A1-2]AXT86657.1 hypothetical protein C6I20_16785 [Aeromicrobium sp. A1-2]
MRSPLHIAALVVALSLTLTACGGPDDDAKDGNPSTSTASADVAGGEKFSTDDFTYTAPQGWKDSSANVNDSVLSLAVDSTDTDGFSDNVNVVGENSIVDIADIDDVAEAAQQSLTLANTTDVQVHDPIEIDGEQAAHVGAIFDQNGTEYRTEQYFVRHGDAGFVITFSFSKDVPDAKRDKLSESVLATWVWTN